VRSRTPGGVGGGDREVFPYPDCAAGNDAFAMLLVKKIDHYHRGSR
jgi:hypothetical protein